MNDRISRNDLLMGTAELLARRSTCERGQVGVVISRNGRMLSSGYNGAPAGMAHCNHKAPEFKAPTYTTTDHEGCTIAVHAEANAIAFAAKYGVSLDKSELHTTLSPCVFCAQLIVNAGIVSVLYLHDYRLRDGIDLLKAADVRVLHFTEF